MAGNREFVGEVYWDGDAFTGRWTVVEGEQVIEEGAIKSLQKEGARFHVAAAARERGYNWQPPGTKA